jgi:hypothetical protein
MANLAQKISFKKYMGIGFVENGDAEEMNSITFFAVKVIYNIV